MSDFEDHRFLTLKQIQDLGGRLQKGSIGIKIFFFRVEEDEQTQESYPILRYYHVYNISQTLGIEKIPTEVSPLGMHARAQQIVTNYKDKPRVYHTGRASYNLETDTVTIPSLYKFKKDEEYFSTLFHEFIHSTGSPLRLGRFGMEQVEYF